jgi:hypothetical protein
MLIPCHSVPPFPVLHGLEEATILAGGAGKIGMDFYALYLFMLLNEQSRETLSFLSPGHHITLPAKPWFVLA